MSIFAQTVRPRTPITPKITTIVAALALAQTGSVSTVHAAPPSANSSTDTHSPDPIRVEVEPSIADAGLYEGWIRERNQAVAASFPDAAGHEQWIAVEIAGDTYDYQVTVTAMRDGEPVGRPGKTQACECSGDALLDFIDEGIVEAVQAFPAPAVVEPEPEQPVVVDAAPSEPVEDDPPRARPLGVGGKVGIGLFAAGAAGIIAGGVVYSQGEKYGSPGVGAYDEGTNFRPPGVALMAVGGAVAGTGIVLLIVDRVTGKKRKTANLHVAPIHRGVALVGRF